MISLVSLVPAHYTIKRFTKSKKRTHFIYPHYQIYIFSNKQEETKSELIIIVDCSRGMITY